VAFYTATRVFDDPNVISYLDRIVEGESRWHTLGLVDGIVILLVVHAFEEQNGEEEIRIISARKAIPRERALYEASY